MLAGDPAAGPYVEFWIDPAVLVDSLPAPHSYTWAAGAYGDVANLYRPGVTRRPWGMDSGIGGFVIDSMTADSFLFGRIDATLAGNDSESNAHPQSGSVHGTIRLAHFQSGC
ncbi:MAG TPA: hypothetical protein VJN95_08840 [Gemmatimonadales bacterium]|nr:hypothetical protein [Gemmatimonadales bacterium]